MSFEASLAQNISSRKDNYLFRERKVLSSAQGGSITLYDEDEGKHKHFINFSSNDYLGFANHPKLIEALRSAVGEYGLGSGASSLVVGYHREHQQLEEALAEFTGHQRALLFSSGYGANLGVLNTILGPGDYVFQDKLNHASLLDGGLASGARFQRYLHKDLSQLQKKIISSNASSNKLIVSDAVFSMDGDCADIKGLATLAKSNNAWLMLDDAHGFGVLGHQGRGSLSEQACASNNADIYMATLGKALGCQGAFVSGSDLLIESLVQFNRHYIYSTALPPAMAKVARKALELLVSETWRRTHIDTLIKTFRKQAKHMGLHVLDSFTPIQPIVLGSAERALYWAEQLANKGILVSAIREPTVAKDTARLRVTLSAAHSEEQVHSLLEALSEVSHGESRLTEQTSLN